MGTLSGLHTGEKIIIAGLFVQIFFFGFFIIIAGMFHYRLVNDKPLQKRSILGKGRRHHQVASTSSSVPITSPYATLSNLPWKRHLYNLYLTSGLIMVRSIFRIIEYLQGNAGYLLSHEVYLYIFDAVLMVAVMVLFNWFHPSEVTEAYHKRLMDTDAAELQQVRDGYMGLDAERGVEESRSKNKAFGGSRMPS
jgi:hypothetical protein